MNPIIPGVAVRRFTGPAHKIAPHSNPDPETLTLFIRCDRTRTTEALFGEFSAALQFPLYFGWNWNSFEDCLGDLGWWPRDRPIVVVLVDVAQLLADDPVGRRTFDDIMDELFGPGASASTVTFVGYARDD